MRPTHIRRVIYVTHSAIAITFISSRNAFTDMPRVMFDYICEHP